MKLPIIISAPHDSDDFGEYSNRVALDWWQIGEFSDKHTFDTGFHPNALGNLKSTLSRGLGSLNQPRDNSLFKLEDFHGNTIWKTGKHLTRKEQNKLFKEHYDEYYNEIKRLINESREKHKFKRVILWDHHDTGDHNPKTGKRDRFLPGENRTMPKFILSNFGIPHTGEMDPTVGFASTPSWFIKKLQNHIAEIFNLKVSEIEINTSYKGGHITQHFGNPKNFYGNEVFAIQIEYNRGFIMDQATRKPNLKKIREMNRKFNKVMEEAVKLLDRNS